MTAVSERPRVAESPRAASGDGGQGERGDRRFAAVSHVVLTLWALAVVLPLLWTLFSSFKDSRSINVSPFALPDTWHWDNYVRAWNTIGVAKYLANTVIVVGSALVLVMVLGAMSAYVLARFRFTGNALVYYVILLGNTFPIFLAVVPLFFVLKNAGLLGTYQGLILVYVAYAYPFTVFFLHSFFKTLPKEIYEAAQVDGAGEWRTFFQVMLPMAKPGMASVAIFNFLGLWNQYLLPTVLNPDQDHYVLSQGLYSMASQQGYNVDYGGLFAAVIITIAPVLLMYIVFQRQLHGGVTAGTMK
ncbi:carbohydrate ABC transporter permease [Lapillicoccus jejuensis]|uniref:Carbohydrate ABC transporter membrane protein 2 (CUT1 family) n=1 Tax=Lapillicoccus jejuensis TaxID=402171 RepID=A0A542E4U4_9MICO|nr:carbohydrate ABC transporter permease [Lapillicoccus jejuensis]TQJ10363.1 carbohydrate ABC transporter membrane protein 2 (CUT1 family) [Lapillicoccus jejuensis]